MDTLSGRRREIAAAVSERRRTLYEIAKALGLRSGDIRSLVHRMHRDGVLRADSEVLAEGCHFWLANSYGPQLERPREVGDPRAGAIFPGQRLIEIDLSNQSLFYGLIQRRDLTAEVLWTIELDTERVLIGMTSDASALDVNRLRAALSSTGTTRAAIAGTPLAVDEMRRYAMAVLEEVEAVPS